MFLDPRQATAVAIDLLVVGKGVGRGWEGRGGGGQLLFRGQIENKCTSSRKGVVQ